MFFFHPYLVTNSTEVSQTSAKTIKHDLKGDESDESDEIGEKGAPEPEEK